MEPVRDSANSPAETGARLSRLAWLGSARLWPHSSEAKCVAGWPRAPTRRVNELLAAFSPVRRPLNWHSRHPELRLRRLWKLWKLLKLWKLWMLSRALLNLQDLQDPQNPQSRHTKPTTQPTETQRKYTSHSSASGIVHTQTHGQTHGQLRQAESQVKRRSTAETAKLFKWPPIFALGCSISWQLF